MATQSDFQVQHIESANEAVADALAIVGDVADDMMDVFEQGLEAVAESYGLAVDETPVAFAGLYRAQVRAALERELNVVFGMMGMRFMQAASSNGRRD